MATFKITYRVIWARYSKENGYPIFLRFKIRGQKPRFQHTEQFIDKEDQWDDDKKKVVRHLNAHKINMALDKKKLELNAQLLTDKLEDRPITANSHKSKRIISSFFNYIKEVRGTSRKTTNLINNITEYQGHEPSIHDITVEWLRKYETHLRTKLKYKDNSVNTFFKILRRVTNQAFLEKYIKERVIGKGAYAMPAPGATTPVFLIKEEREKLLKGCLENKITRGITSRALLYFLLACYSGLRHSDLRRFDLEQHVIGNIFNDKAEDNMLVLRAKKTEELVCLPIINGSSLHKILQAIKLAGPLKMEYKVYNAELKEIAKHFGIKKNISTHVGRHSFGRFCAEQEISMQNCAYYMGIGIKVAEIYYHISGKIRHKQDREKLAA